MHSFPYPSPLLPRSLFGPSVYCVTPLISLSLFLDSLSSLSSSPLITLLRLHYRLSLSQAASQVSNPSATIESSSPPSLQWRSKAARVFVVWFVSLLRRRVGRRWFCRGVGGVGSSTVVLSKIFFTETTKVRPQIHDYHLLSTGVAITSAATKKGEPLFADVSTKLVNKNVTPDVKVDTNSNGILWIIV